MVPLVGRCSDSAWVMTSWMRLALMRCVVLVHACTMRLHGGSSPSAAQHSLRLQKPHAQGPLQMQQMQAVQVARNCARGSGAVCLHLGRCLR